MLLYYKEDLKLEKDNSFDITFPPGTEEMAIKLAAFDIMKQLCEEGKITEDELKYIADKHNIFVE